MWWWIVGTSAVIMFIVVGLPILNWYLNSIWDIHIVVESEHLIDDYKLYHCKYTQGDKTEDRSYVIWGVSGHTNTVFSWPKVQRIGKEESVAVLKAHTKWLTTKKDREKIADIKNKFSSSSYRKSA